MTVIQRKVQGGCPFHIKQVYRDVGMQQRPHDLHVAFLRSHMEGRLTPRVLPVRLCTGRQCGMHSLDEATTGHKAKETQAS